MNNSTLKQKLLKKIKWLESYPQPPDYEFIELLRLAAERIPQDGWVSVENNTPQEHNPILMFHPKENKANHFQVTCIPKLHIFNGATHYMKIPEPPIAARPETKKE